MASRNRTQAEAIYQQQQAARTAAERIGCPVTSLMLATVDEIEAHLDLVDRLARERGLSNPGDLRYWGRGENEIAAALDAVRQRARQRAGTRALVSRYGKASAERIIERETGRRYSLRG
jgi:hypothetical protein